MDRVTVKTSTIFVSVGDRTHVYRSLGDVPPPLRKKLEQSTTGINAATILIADKKGREEIVRAIRGLPTGLEGHVRNAMTASSEKASRLASWNAWLELLLPGVVGLLIWLAFTAR
jgi:hypothetical protein